MSNNCKYLKQKLNRKLECKLDKNKMIPRDCTNCILKEYKYIELKKNCANCYFPNNRKLIKTPLKTGQFNTKTEYKMKQKSKKLAKLEKNRFSVFTNNLDKCYSCPNKKNHLHEVFAGRNRQNSMKYGFVLPLCNSCHSKYQNDLLFNHKWYRMCQKHFETNIGTREEFISIFRKNWL